MFCSKWQYNFILTYRYWHEKKLTAINTCLLFIPSSSFTHIPWFWIIYWPVTWVGSNRLLLTLFLFLSYLFFKIVLVTFPHMWLVFRCWCDLSSLEDFVVEKRFCSSRPSCWNLILFGCNLLKTKNLNAWCWQWMGLFDLMNFKIMLHYLLLVQLKYSPLEK